MATRREREKMNRTFKLNDKLRKHFISLITQRISIVLQMMYQRPDEISDIESGEKYICSVCGLEHKRCEQDPSYRCEIARKAETEFKELELALNRLKNNTFGFCERCSNFIGIDELEKNPTRTFCEECARGFEHQWRNASIG
jgi:RNA polymerase-binding transcription factor DksA